jgi:hypothetical protein
MELNEKLCNARMVESSHGGGTDLSAPCLKPKGHKKKEHLNQNKETWTDAEGLTRYPPYLETKRGSQ